MKAETIRDLLIAIVPKIFFPEKWHAYERIHSLNFRGQSADFPLG